MTFIFLKQKLYMGGFLSLNRHSSTFFRLILRRFHIIVFAFTVIFAIQKIYTNSKNKQKWVRYKQNNG